MKDYYKDLKRDNFSSDEAYLKERVKRGLAAGYTFRQCFDHWLEDFGKALGLNTTTIDQVVNG